MYRHQELALSQTRFLLVDLSLWIARNKHLKLIVVVIKWHENYGYISAFYVYVGVNLLMEAIILYFEISLQVPTLSAFTKCFSKREKILLAAIITHVFFSLHHLGWDIYIKWDNDETLACLNI